MRRSWSLIWAFLGCILGAVALAQYTATIYTEQGGKTQHVGSGGRILVESGGHLGVKSGAILSATGSLIIPSGGALTVQSGGALTVNSGAATTITGAVMATPTLGQTTITGTTTMHGALTANGNITAATRTVSALNLTATSLLTSGTHVVTGLSTLHGAVTANGNITASTSQIQAATAQINKKLILGNDSDEIVGTATISGGSQTVTNSRVTTSSLIFLSAVGDGGDSITWHANTVLSASPGTGSFVIFDEAVNNNDGNQVLYLIITPD